MAGIDLLVIVAHLAEMKWAILLSALTLYGCSEGDRFAEDYAEAERDPAFTGKDMCAAARSAAEAYRNEHNLKKASEWDSKAAMACLRAG